jgi:hypothetical protein
MGAQARQESNFGMLEQAFLDSDSLTGSHESAVRMYCRARICPGEPEFVLVFSWYTQLTRILIADVLYWLLTC